MSRRRRKPPLTVERGCSHHAASNVLTGGFELHPAVKRIAGVVFAGTNDELARASAPRDQSLVQAFGLLYQAIPNVFRTQFRQSVVELGRTGGAGVTHDLEADARFHFRMNALRRVATSFAVFV